MQGQLLFTFLHLAGVEKELTYRLLESGTTAIAYETLENRQGDLPLLAPLSAIAGNMAALVGSFIWPNLIMEMVCSWDQSWVSGMGKC